MGVDGVEQFVSTPELHSDEAIEADPLPPGQVWAISPGGQEAAPALYRIEATSGPGSGVKILNAPIPPAFRESVRCGEQNLYSRAKELVGDRDPRSHEFTVQLRAMDSDRSGHGLGLPVLLALCGNLMERSTKGGLIVVGSLNLGGSVDMIPNPVAVAELAVEKGASQLLMPVSSRRQLLDLPDEMATKVNIVFYADVADAFLKAILGRAAASLDAGENLNAAAEFLRPPDQAFGDRSNDWLGVAARPGAIGPPVEPQAVHPVGPGVGEFSGQGVEPGGDFARRNVELGFFDHVAGQFVGQPADGEPAFGHRGQQLGHAHEAVADKPDPRIDRSAVALSTEHGIVGQHAIDDVGFADGRAVERDAVPGGNVLGHPARRAVGHDRPLALLEDMLGADRQRVLLAEVAPLGIDHGQPVGIRIR